jgi:predicted nucleotide-binding protein (sugar kinase/HSP70/actin superfamily)
MGTTDYLLKHFCEQMEIDFVLPPPTTTKTLQLGFKYAPEGACLPLKIFIGNFIEAMELGADTLLMIGGTGPCRLGYYGEVQRRLLDAAGFDFEMLILEARKVDVFSFVRIAHQLAPNKHLWDMWKTFKTSFQKARILDELEKRVLAQRAYERVPGTVSRAWQEAISIIDEARSPEAIEAAKLAAFARVERVPCDPERDVLRVGLVGEFFILLEPFLKFGLEEQLGNLGVSLERAVYVCDWMSPGSKNPVVGVTNVEIEEAARPFLAHPVGGEGIRSVGQSVLYAQNGFDGIVHLFPFTCMPDGIAKAILKRVGRELEIPILTFVIDEHTWRAGVITRLEAFVDLMRARRQKLAAAGVNTSRA